MDISSLLGPIIALATIIAGLFLEGGHLDSILQIPAAMIVFGGTFGALFVAYPIGDFFFALKELITWVAPPIAKPDKLRDELVELAQLARQESVLALEQRRDDISFEPLNTAIKLAVDGTDPAIIKSTLTKSLDVAYEQQLVAVKFWEDAGAIAPTIGILGAVLGLIHVMENLSKPELIGPGIAVAFVATLYGVGGANIFFIPIGKKLRRKYMIESLGREMVIIGIDAILAGLNPKVVEEKLAVFCRTEMASGDGE